VVFGAAPLMVLTGLAMSPALTAAFPLLLNLFGGYQSARTIHFFTFVALLLFVFVHVVMVIKSGFRDQIRAMTVGG
jgi:thiosulfate reductase cytochrome b subunit